ncbi:MAG TPA: hypothetical protein DEQ40_09100 [Oxalobacteraceae bacterium]|jgi:hypothetical protein|nr:hypothetical protein [Oxalobacteraceae bacterium]
MMDRFGRLILLGWPEHHILYVEAALTLPRHEKFAALYDIAEITGRSIKAVRMKANQLAAKKIHDAAEAETARRILVAERYRPNRPAVLPTELLQPTKYQLMGARA